MKLFQNEIVLEARHRGFHLVTDEIVKQLPELQNIKTGMASILIKHTSASLTLNENFDPDVRTDMESYFSNAVKENDPSEDAEVMLAVFPFPDMTAARINATIATILMTVKKTCTRRSVPRPRK